jgi:hypothetical protein
MILIGVTIAGVMGTMYQTWRVADNTALRADLTYRQTITELEQTLEGLGSDSLIQVVRARITSSASESIWVDTLAVIADTLLEPALATGGFLRDEIARYNDAAVRRALVAGLSGSTRSPTGDTPVGDTPVDPGNLLRVVKAAGGRLRVSDRVNATGLVVRSPGAERDWRPVQTADAGNVVALVGQSGTLPLMPNAEGRRASVNGRTCEVRGGLQRAMVYCGAVLGADVNRFYDLGLEKPPASRALRLDTYRGSRLWLNGRSATARGLRIAPGTIGETRATGPFLLSGISGGQLAAEQWVNGRRQLVDQSGLTIGFFGRAGRSARWPVGGAPLRLSLDEALSADIDQAARDYFLTQSDLLEAMSVVILDVATGQVRAIAEPARTSANAPLLAFEPRLVGSVVKPIVAAAILARNPALGNFVVDYGGPLVTAVDGVSLGSPFDNAANGCGARIDFVAFLRCSSNRYAAELLLRSLRRNGYAPSRDGNRVPHAILERSDVADGLALVFDVDAYAGRTAGRTVPVWDVESQTDAGIVQAVTDPSLVPYESRPWLLSRTGEATPVEWLVRYAFGGWENRWTLLGVAQAYARIATDREVPLSFLQRGAPGSIPTMGDSVARAMRRVREALMEVGASGTAAPLNAALARVLGSGVTVLSKTGTLNEASPDDLAVKALAMAVGQQATPARGAPLRCGLAIVTYFDFDAEAIRRSGAAALPSVHVEFATQYLPRVLEHHWKRVSACSTPSPSTPS